MTKYVGAGLLAYLAVFVAAVIGYVLNVVAIFGMWSGPLTTEVVIRLVGCVFAPLGAIAGYF